MPVADQLTNPLEFGAVAGAILQAQRSLRRHGYNVQESGTLDRRTEVALYAYQRRSNLKAHGILDRETALGLDRSAGEPDPGAIFGDAPKMAPTVAKIARPLWLEMALWICDMFPAKNQIISGKRIDWALDPIGDTMAQRTREKIKGSAAFVSRTLVDPTIVPATQLPDNPSAFASTLWGGVRLGDIAVGAIAPMIEDGFDHVVIVIGRAMGNDDIICAGFNQVMGGIAMATSERFSPMRFNKGFWWPGSEPQPAAFGAASMPIVQDTGHFSHHEVPHGVVSRDHQ